MRHFLLLYNVERGELTTPPREFRKADEAMRAYAEAEQAHRDDATMQVVLVASDSIETVKVTHGNFFRMSTFEEVVREATAEFRLLHFH